MVTCDVDVNNAKGRTVSATVRTFSRLHCARIKWPKLWILR